MGNEGMYFFHAYPYFWLDFLRSEFWLEIIIPFCKSTLRNTKMVSEFNSDVKNRTDVQSLMVVPSKLWRFEWSGKEIIVDM